MLESVNFSPLLYCKSFRDSQEHYKCQQSVCLNQHYVDWSINFSVAYMQSIVLMSDELRSVQLEISASHVPYLHFLTACWIWSLYLSLALFGPRSRPVAQRAMQMRVSRNKRPLRARKARLRCITEMEDDKNGVDKPQVETHAWLNFCLLKRRSRVGIAVPYDSWTAITYQLYSTSRIHRLNSSEEILQTYSFFFRSFFHTVI